ncbi:MAG TPA: hypothetical protein VIS07_07840 [Candidatus Binatia bacterium]
MRAVLSVLACVMLLCATSAHGRTSVERRTICTIGDSLNLASTTNWSTLGLSPFRTAHAIEMLLRATSPHHPWHRARVIDLSVPGTGPSDWLGPIEPERCRVQARYYPHARAACASGAGMVDHIPVGVCDIFLVMGDGSELALPGVTAEGTVDRIEELVAELDEIDAGHGVLLSTPPLARSLDGEPINTALFDRVRAEMLARGIVNGPDWANRFHVGFDQLHFRDVSILAMADAWVRALP